MLAAGYEIIVGNKEIGRSSSTVNSVGETIVKPSRTRDTPSIIFLAPLMGARNQRLSLLALRRRRSNENRTSRAVRRRPSWNRTPGLSRNRKRVPPASDWNSEASHG